MMKYTILCVIILSASAFGGCLNDNDYWHPASDYNTRYFSYSAKSAARVSSSSDLSFMSYNLQSGFSSSCVSNPNTQAALMSSVDYVGTQETVQGVDTRCNCNIPKIIADVTGMATRFLMTIPFRTGQYGIGLGTSQTILETRNQLFTYNGVEQRGCVAVKTQPLALSGRYLWFVSTHVEYYKWEARQSQIAQLLTFVEGLKSADPTAVFVLTGDFNGGPDDTSYATLSRTFKNSWEVYNGSPAGGFTYPANWISYRFDHIWFSAPSDVTVTVKSVNVLEPQHSDHRALQAVLSFAPKKSATPAPPAIAATSAPATPKPATNAPATNAPATSAPATPKPATNAPATPKPATNAPATNAPATNAPATNAPATPKPATNAPSTGSCSASVVTSSSATPLVVTNTGSKPIKSLLISFSPSIPSNNWNLVSVGSSQYSLPDWAYQSLIPGASFSSAGFYTTGPVPTATVVSIIC